MTQEETISILEESKRQNEIMRDNPSTFWASHQMAEGVKNAKRRIEALDYALSALHPVSREQVEKVWRGEWIIVYDEDKEITIATCSKCGDETAYGGSLKADDCDAFCPVCGAPMMDEAVGILLKRLEALHENIYNG